MVQVGEIYKHFKGELYGVLAIAKHHESKEEYVVYKSLLTSEIYIRPLKEFEGYSFNQKRFNLVDKVDINFG